MVNSHGYRIQSIHPAIGIALRELLPNTLEYRPEIDLIKALFFKIAVDFRTNTAGAKHGNFAIFIGVEIFLCPFEIRESYRSWINRIFKGTDLHLIMIAISTLRRLDQRLTDSNPRV